MIRVNDNKYSARKKLIKASDDLKAARIKYFLADSIFYTFIKG